MILALRTDKPDAELYLLSQDSKDQIEHFTWQAHRELSDTLLTQIDQLLTRHKLEKTDLTGVVVYQGPGSFTGLRIGITVANTLAYSLDIPIAAAEGEQWLKSSLVTLQKNPTRESIIPHYGAEANITAPRK